MISYSQPVHGFRQSNRDYSALPLNQRNDLSWLSRWGSHGECNNVYGYTLDEIYDKSWYTAIRLS